MQKNPEATGMDLIRSEIWFAVSSAESQLKCSGNEEEKGARNYCRINPEYCLMFQRRQEHWANMQYRRGSVF